MSRGEGIGSDAELAVRALSGLPVVGSGADLGGLVLDALFRDGIRLRQGDVIVVASKVISRAEGCFVDLGAIEVGVRASELARDVGADPRVVELVLRESAEISRAAPGALVVRNRLGVVGANAGVDLSNARPLDAAEGTGPWALTLPKDPDASAERLRGALVERTGTGAAIGVVVSDSVGRPFRLGSVGAAIGIAGIPALSDQRGSRDLFGMRLEHTVTAFADQIAAAADLVAGQAAEGRGVVHVRGLRFPAASSSARELLRPASEDLYVASPAGREK